MPPNRFESEVESFLEGSHGDRTHIKRADHPRLHHYAGRYSAARPAFRSSPLPSGLLHSGVATKKPRFCLLIRGIALLREALHYLVASALLAYLVHRFLTQRIPAHAHGVCG